MDQIQDAMVSSFANIARLMIIVMIVIAGGVILWKLLTTKLLNFIGSKFSSPRMVSNSSSNDEYINSYTPKWLFSVNERDVFYKIKNVTDKLNLVLLAKVRLIDLIEPKEGIKNYKGAQWKIQSKHVDFVICNEKLVAKIIIELDDSSHNTIERQKRDVFVDEVLTRNGFRVMHLWAINEARLEQQIKDILRM